MTERVYFLDTFAGMAGLRIGMEDGLAAQAIEAQCVGTSEIKTHALNTLAHLYPDEQFEYTDITQLDTDDIPHIDALIGGFPCFTGNTLVLTKKGYKPIQEIKKGDEVLTHNKRYRKVVNPLNQGVKDTVLFKTVFDTNGIETTNNHKFYVRELTETGMNSPEWLEVEKLTTDHFAGVPVNPIEELPVWKSEKKGSRVISDNLDNPSFWWVMGRYLANGWLHEINRGRPSGIVLSEGSDEERTEYEKHLNNLKGVTYSNVSDRNKYNYHITSSEVGEYAKQFGRLDKFKRLTGDILNLPIPLLESFLEGYCNGCNKKREEGTALVLESKSRALLVGLGQCVAKVYKQPYVIHKQSCSTPDLNGGYLMEEYEYLTLLPQENKYGAFYEDGYLWGPVGEVTPRGPQEVFDIEVEEDHSFTVFNVIAHNCQPFSMSGKRLGLEDTRGTLFYDLARILKEKQPRFAIFENVQGLVHHDKGRTLPVIIETFESMGYHISYKLFNSADYGCAGTRKRLFIVCHKDFTVDLERISKIENGPVLKDIMEHGVPTSQSEYTQNLLKAFEVEDLYGRTISDKKGGQRVVRSWQFEARGEVSDLQVEVLTAINKLQASSRRFKEHGSTVPISYLQKEFSEIEPDELKELLDDLLEKKYLRTEKDGVRLLFGQLSGEFTRILDPDKKINTFTATDLSRMAVPVDNGLRSLTIKECLRALGFPKDYTFPETVSINNQYDLIGNTVAPPVAQYITETIIEQEREYNKKKGESSTWEREKG